MDIRITRDYTIRDLITDYQNLRADGVYALSGNLEVRPPYQREQVYGIGNDKDSKVIESILGGGPQGYPIGLMYWCKKDDGTFECLDGQQRIISICEFAKNRVRVTIDGTIQKYEDLAAGNSPLIDKFLNYRLLVAICETQDYNEKIRWFERINVSGEPLNAQEMRNAIYAGTWTTEAKRYFSKDRCTAWHRTTKQEYPIMGNKDLTRQLWLEQVLIWKLQYDGIEMNTAEARAAAIQNYMLDHHNNPDANDLIEYFEDMVDWVKRNFKPRKMMEKVNWGALYNQYHTIELKKNETEEYIVQLEKYAKQDGITNIAGVYEYLFDGNIAHLQDRAFSKEIKLAVWDTQEHKCKVCEEEFAFEDMCGDHRIPWSKGGTTTMKNCDMLCTKCNGIKSNKWTTEAKAFALSLQHKK